MDELGIGDGTALGDAPEFHHGHLHVFGAGLRHREGRRDALVLLCRGARLGLLLRDLVLDLHHFEPAPAAEKGAGGQPERARGQDAALQPPDEEAAPVLAAGKLLGWRLLRREVQEQRLGLRALGRGAQLDRAQRLVVVERAELQAGVGHQRLLENRALPRWRQHQHLHRRALARQRPQRHQVLRQALRLGAHEHRQRLRHHLHHPLQTRKAQLALVDVALAQAGAVGADDQRAPFARAELRGERGGEQRHRVDAGEASVGLLQRVEPGRELLRVGEGGEQQALVAPLGGDHRAERQRGHQARVAVALRQAPLHHGVAVGAAQVGNLVLVEVLARQVGEHGVERAAVRAQVFAERADPQVVAGEARLELERARRGPVEVMVLGGKVENAADGHGASAS